MEIPELKTGYNPELIDTIFVSGIVGDSIKVEVSLPSGYKDNPEKTYPVVYLTDGYWRREEHATIHQMSINGEIRDVIVVGIGYPDGYDFNVIRVRDLITNADKLFASIKYEIIPYVEENFHASKQLRTLWGSSYGGHFLIYAFSLHLTQGKMFKNYICASAALDPPYEHHDLLENIKKMGITRDLSGVNFYLTVGGLEANNFVESYNTIVDSIDHEKFEYFNFIYEIIPETDHFTVWKPTLIKGLKMFLN